MIGTQVTVVADIETIATALPEVRPTFWGAMPLVWEKLKTGIEANVAAETGVKHGRNRLTSIAIGREPLRSAPRLAPTNPGWKHVLHAD